MFNLLAVTGRRQALQKRLAELAEGAPERFEVEEKLQGIEERLKDWETEVRLGSLPFGHERGTLLMAWTLLVQNTLRRHNYIGLVRTSSHRSAVSHVRC